ncbi:chorismate--pyruvate lyase [Paludicola sp. MB14-C6]|uniref:chorismate--pyruvate lyase n=1 Tax=Paludihabitans sp. MB14-C6 TaxID=3070656 RepID=UPI0027DB2AA6|nr:chorismate--pyruvate lyase [Paludicola sp. MB14-C6]WMJ24350.1 chorismate--pyruvate lyase [Paludicola sp. MB14-C6]
METKYYIVQKIDGDYAILLRTDTTEEDTILVARFLLPMEIDEGSNLIWENLEYKIL